MKKLSGLVLVGLALISSPLHAQTEVPPAAPVQTPQDAPPTNTIQVTTTSTNAVDLDKDRALKAKLKAWTGLLAQVAKQENTCLFFDVAPDDTPPNAAYDRPLGAVAMRALATAARRTWKQVDGVQTFTRAQDMAHPTGGVDDVNQAIAWVGALSPAQRTLLIKGELSFDQLDPQSRSLMSRVAGWIPDMSFVLLEKGNRVGVGLRLTPQITYTDPKTGKRVTREIDGVADTVKVPTTDTPLALEALAPADPGPLDFGKGAMMTLADIIEKAQTAFHVHYTPVDRRVAKNFYFVSGLLTPQAFEEALAQATAIPPLRLRPVRPIDRAAARALLDDPEFLNHDIDVTKLRARLITGSLDMDALNDRFGPKEMLSTQDFLSGKTVTLAELSDGKPGLTAYLAGMGLTPDTPLVLSAYPVLVVKADRNHIASGGSCIVNGQPVPVYMSNETDAGLW